jgi:hypothetical protein
MLDHLDGAHERHRHDSHGDFYFSPDGVGPCPREDPCSFQIRHNAFNRIAIDADGASVRVREGCGGMRPLDDPNKEVSKRR